MPLRPASAAALATAASHAAGSSPHGKRDICSTIVSLAGCGALAADRVRCLWHRLVSVAYHHPALRSDLRCDVGHPAQLAVEHGGRHGPGAAAVPAAALGGIGAEQHGYGR